MAARPVLAGAGVAGQLGRRLAAAQSQRISAASSSPTTTIRSAGKSLSASSTASTGSASPARVSTASTSGTPATVAPSARARASASARSSSSSVAYQWRFLRAPARRAAPAPRCHERTYRVRPAGRAARRARRRARSRSRARSCPVGHPFDAHRLGAMGAAVDGAFGLDAVADHAAAAVAADGRERMDRALKLSET